MAEHYRQVKADDLGSAMSEMFKKRPGSSQFIQLIKEGKVVGSFSIKLVREGDATFARIEDVSPTELGAAFTPLSRVNEADRADGIFMVPYTSNKS